MESLLQNGIQYKTCAEMRKANPFLKSGMFWIDPDGHGIGDDPIRVYCDMTEVTEVSPYVSSAPHIYHIILVVTSIHDSSKNIQSANWRRK